MSIAKGLTAGALLLALTATSGWAQSFGFATYTATVANTGRMVRGLGVQSAARTGLGAYSVTFARRSQSAQLDRPLAPPSFAPAIVTPSIRTGAESVSPDTVRGLSDASCVGCFFASRSAKSSEKPPHRSTPPASVTGSFHVPAARNTGHGAPSQRTASPSAFAIVLTALFGVRPSLASSPLVDT